MRPPGGTPATRGGTSGVNALAVSHRQPVETVTRAAAVRPIDILLVGDNSADLRSTLEALHDAKISNHVSIAHSGDEALRLCAVKAGLPMRRGPT